MVSERVSRAGSADVPRYLAVISGLLILALGVGFGLNMPWATGVWPWPDGKLSYLFVGSVLGAMAAALVWIGVTGEWKVLVDGSITALVMTAGMAAYLFQLSREAGREGLAVYALVLGVGGVVSLGFFLWSRRYVMQDSRRTPMLVRVSYLVFVVALVLAAAALILRVPNVFPWPLNRDSSVMFGLIFSANAVYYLYAALSPQWHNARTQLLSFLVYDLFLIPPFLGLLATVGQDHLVSLIVYLVVLFYSAGLAVYYLMLNPATRGWAGE